MAAAESQLEAAQAQDTNLGIARAQYEHAIAILVGESPSTYSLSAALKDISIFRKSSRVPAELLERRPDIATAERAMAGPMRRSAWQRQLISRMSRSAPREESKACLF